MRNSGISGGADHGSETVEMHPEQRRSDLVNLLGSCWSPPDGNLRSNVRPQQLDLPPGDVLSRQRADEAHEFVACGCWREQQAKRLLGAVGLGTATQHDIRF